MRMQVALSNAVLWRVLLLGMILILSGCSEDSGTNPAPQDSHIFTQFLEDIDNLAIHQRQQRVNQLFHDIEADSSLTIPLISDDQCIFLYKRPTTNVRVPGDHNNWDVDSDTMIALEGTDLRYLIKSFPADARLDYKFFSSIIWLPDILNPRLVEREDGFVSEVAMPGYEEPAEVEAYYFLHHGTLERHNFNSVVLGNNRDVKVYLPPDYTDTGAEYPVLYVLDGSCYLIYGSMRNILDYCISYQKCVPVVAVFVDALEGESELELNTLFMEMFTDELMPFIEGEYHISSELSKTGILGASDGGASSLYFAYHNPDLFGLAGGQSPMIELNGSEVAGLYQDNDQIPVKIYMDCGSFESRLESIRGMQSILESKGYDFQYNEYSDGHSWGNWRGHIDTVLEFFFPFGE